MIQITVASTALRELKGDSKTTGKPYHLRIQSAYAHTVEPDGTRAPFPEKFEILLESDQSPWAVGEYQLHPSAAYVSRDGRLECSPRLTPLKQPTRAAA